MSLCVKKYQSKNWINYLVEQKCILLILKKESSRIVMCKKANKDYYRGEINLKKILLLIFAMIFYFQTISFAHSEFIKDEAESIDLMEIDTDGLIYDENYDFSMSYDENENNIEEIYLKGIVLEASKPYEYDNGYLKEKVQKLKVEITDKLHNGEEYEILYYLENENNPRLPEYKELSVGDKVYVYANFEDGKLLGDAYIAYYDKTNWFLLIVAIFSVTVLLIGGKQGIKALVGLFVTIGLIFYILIPGIIEGKEPINLTIFICSLTILFTFLIISGFHKKTFSAILGTIAGVVAAGLIGGIFSDLMLITGVNEDARKLSVYVPETQEMLDFEGILLAGIMISALGACMDVGMSIASSIAELKKENPKMTSAKLIKSGMNIGKDVMGTMTNTLILAYVGGSLGCILLYTINNFDLVTVLNHDEITYEILQALAGSIGLIFTIPFTALVSGLIIGKDFDDLKNKSTDSDEVKVKYFKG